MLHGEIAKAVHDFLGLEWKQYGNTMCFLTITYCNSENNVIEEWFVSAIFFKFVSLKNLKRNLSEVMYLVAQPQYLHS